MQSQTASYCLTTLAAAPSSAALASLADVKDELDIPTTDTSNDARLTRFIAEESASIARYCNRVFGLATWQDLFRPQRDVRGEGVRGAHNPLKLARAPLLNNAVLFTGTTTAGNRYVSAIPSTAGLAAGMPVYGTGLPGTQSSPTFGSGIPAGTVIDQVTPTSVLLSAAATASNTAAAFTAGLSVVETIANVSTQLIAGQDFEIDAGSLLPGDEGRGLLYRLNELGHPRTWPPSEIVVNYQAGYALPDDDYDSSIQTLPADLKSVCVRLVVWRYRARGRDPMLVERTQTQALGSERYWVGPTPGQSGPWPADIMSVVDLYRVPVVS
jgi:hypothetical protein